MNLAEKLLFIGLFLVAAALSGLAHYSVVQHWLLPIGRETTFWVSAALILGLLVAAVLEQRLLWRGMFDLSGRDMRRPNAARYTLAPPPLSLGAMLGVSSFLVWS